MKKAGRSHWGSCKWCKGKKGATGLGTALAFAHMDSQRISFTGGVLKTIKRRIFPQEWRLEEP